MILQILINNMQGEEFDEMFGNDTERQKREAENRRASTKQDAQTGASGTAEDLKYSNNNSIYCYNQDCALQKSIQLTKQNQPPKTAPTFFTIDKKRNFLIRQFC
ncbi:hypothetical protein LOD99_11162 [Oopsacas minuta]|uniref:Uncharacterized protein n=1 Tax=Oopsacas minuta TaxID=111878 RepID=A0AAV7K7N5_9METZ|nr:hypothetical protein LOD99_11162 [Oopsacas minuta]